MFGAICGDIIGSYYESHSTKNYDFNLFNKDSIFTDDTVLTAAVCDTLLLNSENATFFGKQKRAAEYAYKYKQYYKRYPNAGFGQMFQSWANKTTLSKQNSYANGAAMRTVPIAYAYNNLNEVEVQAKLSSIYTHNHNQAIKGAQAIACVVFLARHNKSKEEILKYIENRYKYNLSISIDLIKSNYVFDSKTAYTVPPAIIAFLQSNSFEDAIRKAVSLGGDADTIACMTGGMAEAYYKIIPEEIKNKCWSKLDIGLKQTIKKFNNKFNLKSFSF